MFWYPLKILENSYKVSLKNLFKRELDNAPILFLIFLNQFECPLQVISMLKERLGVEKDKKLPTVDYK